MIKRIAIFIGLTVLTLPTLAQTCERYCVINSDGSVTCYECGIAYFSGERDNLELNDFELVYAESQSQTHSIPQ